MWKYIVSMYVTLMPTVLAGIGNMAFCKLPVLKKLKKPIDGGKTLKDNERVFGDNKTWKGFIGYVLFGVVFSCLWGFLLNLSRLNSFDFFYTGHDNTILFNVLIGSLQGLFYALFELPNSFLKRRLHIVPGKNPKGFKKVFFIFLDQADSIFGVVLVVFMFAKLPVWFYFVYVLTGAATHIVINMLLYLLKLRKNMF